MQKSRIVVWGIRDDYEMIYNQLQMEIQKVNIEIVALCCRKADIPSPTKDGYPIVSKETLADYDFDFIVIANDLAYKSIYKEAQEVVAQKKLAEPSKEITIVSSNIFTIPRFDFKTFVTNNNVVTKQPLLSVVVPVYNVEKYLRECLDSVVNQHYQNLDIICVNDGSTDGSITILEEYQKKDNRIRIITQENAGASAARNTGIDAALGDYIAFVDSDDFIYRSTYAEAMSCFIDDDIDLIWFSIQKRIECNNFIGSSVSSIFTSPLNYTGSVYIEPKNIKANFTSSCCMIFKKNILNNYHLRFPVSNRFEDSCFTTEYAACCRKVYFLTKPYYIYRIRESSISTSNKLISYSKDILDCSIHLLNFYISNNLIEKFDKLYVNYFTRCCLFFLKLNNNEQSIDILLEYIEENKHLYSKSLHTKKILKIINLNQNNLCNLLESLQKLI